MMKGDDIFMFVSSTNNFEKRTLPVKKIIVVNSINLLLFAILAIAYIITDAPPAFLLLFAAWLVYVSVTNYQIFVKDMDRIGELKNADKKRLFNQEIKMLGQSLQSVDFYKPLFEDNDDPVNAARNSYELLEERAYQNVEKALTWIQHYDYITKPNREYLTSLTQENETIVRKLNELNDIMLKAKDNKEDIDLSNIIFW